MRSRCWGSRSPWERTILRGKGWPIVKYGEYRPFVAAMQPFVKLLWPLVTLHATRRRLCQWRSRIFRSPCHNFSPTALPLTLTFVGKRLAGDDRARPWPGSRPCCPLCARNELPGFQQDRDTNVVPVCQRIRPTDKEDLQLIHQTQNSVDSPQWRMMWRHPPLYGDI